MNGEGTHAAVKRIASTLGVTLFIVASLVVFPGWFSLMAAAYVAWHSWQRLTGRPAWAPLALCLIVLLVRRTDWPPGLIAFGAVTIVVALLELARSRSVRQSSRRYLAVSLSAVWLAWLLFAIDWRESSHASRQLASLAGRPVVCLGDSLTSGVPPDGGYPKELAKLLSAPVLDFGRPGITSTEGLKLLPEIVAAKPAAVVIELGGHDFLKGLDRASTKKNLEAIIAAVRQAGGEPILMEIPRGFIVDPYAGLERELAREHDLELVSDACIRRLVIYSPHAPPGMWTGGPHYSEDGLHPNRSGNENIARAVRNSLTNVFGTSVEAKP